MKSYIIHPAFKARFLKSIF